MGIRVCEEKKIFSISTPNTTYLMGVSGETCWVICITETDGGYGRLLSAPQRRQPEEKHNHLRDKVGYLDSFSFEYPVWGTGDFRDPCLRVRDENGYRACELHYEAYEILEGKPALSGMPSTFAGKEEGQVPGPLSLRSETKYWA